MSSTKSEESYNYVEEMDDKNDCDIEMKVDTVEHLKTEDTEEKYCAKVGKKKQNKLGCPLGPVCLESYSMR